MTTDNTPTTADIAALEAQLTAAKAAAAEARKAVRDAKRAAGADERSARTGRVAAINTAKREIDRRERARQREMHARAGAMAHITTQADGRGIKAALAARKAVLDSEVTYPVTQVSHDDWVLDDDVLQVIAALQEANDAEDSDDS